MPGMTAHARANGFPSRRIVSLAGFGFGRGARVRPTGQANGEYGRGLRRALEEAGPIFALFGIYLSSRADLLSLADCMELARIPDEAPPMPVSRIHAMVPACCDIIGEPAESRILYQSHWAWLRNGRKVQIRVTRPELRSWLQSAEAFFAGCSSSTRYHAAARDFRQNLVRRIDFQAVLAGIQTSERDASRIDSLSVPKVLEELSGAEALVLEFPTEPAHPALAKPRDAARAICAAWLAETLEGRVFPVDVRLQSVKMLGRRICFATDEYGALTRDAQQMLWEYLNAAASDEPETCARCLASEMHAGRHCLGEKALVQRIRQIVPFRDGAWENGPGQSLAEHLFLHWKLAWECGYQPRPQLLAFWRGLFGIAVTAYQLDPFPDAFSTALREMRTTRLLSQMQEFIDVSRLGDKFDQYSTMALSFPKRMNDLLDQAGSGRLGLRLNASEESAGGEARPLLLAALLMIFAGTAVYSRLLAPMLGHSVWFDRIGFFILLALGSAMIRLAARTK